MSKPRKTSRQPAPPSPRAENAKPQLRGRITIEIAGKSALTEAAADLLEQIAATGSLSQAARKLSLSYRWAWLLLDGMNRTWPAPLVTTATGGARGGGARLTEAGQAALAAYRHLQLELEHFLGLQTPDFQRNTRISFL